MEWWYQHLMSEVSALAPSIWHCNIITKSLKEVYIALPLRDLFYLLTCLLWIWFLVSRVCIIVRNHNQSVTHCWTGTFASLSSYHHVISTWPIFCFYFLQAELGVWTACVLNEYPSTYCLNIIILDNFVLHFKVCFRFQSLLAVALHAYSNKTCMYSQKSCSRSFKYFTSAF